MCAILGAVQNPYIPSSLTGLCWLHSMPPCQWKTVVVRSTHFCEWSFPGPIYSKLAFHLVMVDTLTKQINSKVSKSLWWIFSDFFSLSSQAWWSTVMRSCPFGCSRPPGTTNEVMLQFGCINVDSTLPKWKPQFKLRCSRSSQEKHSSRLLILLSATPTLQHC